MEGARTECRAKRSEEGKEVGGVGGREGVACAA